MYSWCCNMNESFHLLFMCVYGCISALLLLESWLIKSCWTKKNILDYVSMICQDRNCECVIFTCLFDLGGGEKWHPHHISLLTITGYVSPIMRFVHVKCHEMTMNPSNRNTCNREKPVSLQSQSNKKWNTLYLVYAEGRFRTFNVVRLSIAFKVTPLSEVLPFDYTHHSSSAVLMY